MENVLKRFPHLGGLILDNLDNTSLITCKKARRDVSEFLEKEKLIGLRVLRKYHRNFNKFKELWKEVIDKISLAMLKQLAVAVQNFFRLYPIIQNLESNQIAPIHIAAEQSNVNLCEFIYEKTKNKNPVAILQLDCNDDKIEIAKQSMRYIETDLTPLHIAAIKGNLEVFKLIFVNELYTNSANEKEKLTPLHIAAQNGHFEICEYILENVEDKNPPRKYERTPFHTAVSNGYLEICKLMIKNVSDINSADSYGETPLHIAARNGHVEICRIIIENMKDKNQTELLELILKHRAEPLYSPACFTSAAIKNHADLDGKTPLHLAAEQGYFKICQLLIDNIDDKHPIAANDMTPKDYAKRYGHYEIVELFNDKKKRKNAKGKK